MQSQIDTIHTVTANNSCCDTLFALLAQLQNQVNQVAASSASCCDALATSTGQLAQEIADLEMQILCSQCIKCYCTDFEQFNAGDTVNTINAGLHGVVLSSSSSYAKAGPLMIFDSANPTGGDSALGSPNEDCCPGCPGQGEGGEPGKPGANCRPRGNVLIISDNSSKVPKAFAHGGVITIQFATPVMFREIGLLNNDVTTDTIQLFDVNGNPLLSPTQQVIPNLGCNGYQTLCFNTPGVTKVTLTINTLAAITHFCWAVDMDDAGPYFGDDEYGRRIIALESCCDRLTVRK